MSEPREFDCRDCGIHVVSWALHPAANDQDICAECQWLRGIEDPQQREELRKFLGGFHE